MTFGQTGARHVRQFHLGLARGGVPRGALCDIRRNRTSRLRHLVKLPSARVILQIEKTPAEILGTELNNIR